MKNIEPRSKTLAVLPLRAVTPLAQVKSFSISTNYLWLFFVFLFWRCQDVVEVDLPATESRLVIDAVIRVDRTDAFAQVEIKVKETSDFFSDNIITELESAVIFYGMPVEGAPELFDVVFRSSLAELQPGTGIYGPDPNFSTDQRIPTSIVQPGFVFQLLIEHQGREYFATTPFSPSVPIDSLVQGDEILFDEDDKELIVTFTDIPDEKNYYVFDFDFGEFLAADDQFIDGQQFEFSYFYQKDLAPGTVAEVSILGADQQFHNYMNLLVEQTVDNGGVFETPAITVRGNIFDVTDLDNITVFDNVEQPEIFPLGYFAVVEEFKRTIVIE
ncbi:MAG: DUF4249 family protein [Bacteroidota bacterium]